MARFIEAGPTTFDALVYGRPHPGTLNFLQQQFETTSNRLTQFGQQFMDGAYELWDRLSSSRAVEAMRQAARAVSSVWQADEIRPLMSLGDFQYAPMSMQRFIMAEPTVRQMYHDQTIDGYSDTYIDMYPNSIGEDHYDYRRAMDGFVVVNESDEDDESEWTATTYFDDLVEGDQDLLLSEQVDIQCTWDWLRSRIKPGMDDPTSRYSSKI